MWFKEKNKRRQEIRGILVRIGELESRVRQLECKHPMVDRKIETVFYMGILLSREDEICGKCGKTIKERAKPDEVEKKVLKAQLKELENKIGKK